MSFQKHRYSVTGIEDTYLCKKLHNTYCLLPEWTTASSSHPQCCQAVIILEEEIIFNL